MKNKNNVTLTLPRKSDPALWARISGQIEALASDKAFAAKLRAATPQGQRPRDLLHEYLRFAYLAWTGPTSSTPSEIVDRAWHAHILCTRSYAAFCEATAGRTLHHDPGTGDRDERRGFDAAYRATWVRYRAEFGEPPVAFWPRPAGVPRVQAVRKRTATEAIAWMATWAAIPGTAALYLGGGWAFASILAGVMSLVGMAVYATNVEAEIASQRTATVGKGKPGDSSTTSSSGGDGFVPTMMASTACDGGSGGDGGGSSCGGGGCGS